MKSKQFRKRIILSIFLVCHYQQTKAAGLIKASQAENVTATSEQINEEQSEGTTNMPELDTTIWPADFQVDGRHAFINNQFVAEDEEPLTSAPASPAYNHLETSNYGTAMDYQDQEITHIKTPVRNHPALAQKLPSSTISDDDMDPFEDYTDEETGEDKAEHDKDTQTQIMQQQHGDKMTKIYASTHQNKLYDSANYKTQTSANLAGSYYNNNFIPNTSLNTGILYASKPDALHTTQQQQQQQALVKTKLTYTGQPSFDYYNKPAYNLYDKLNSSNDTTEPLLKQMPGNSNTFYTDNADGQTASPGSSNSGPNKRFKTVSSSIQYVSTPLADLVFKYSIGMAKHTNSKPSSEHLKPSFKIK